MHRTVMTRYKAMIVILNGSEQTMRDQLYILDPERIFGGRNQLTLADVFKTYDLSHIPEDAGWGPRALGSAVGRYARDKQFGKTALRDMEDNGFVRYNERLFKWDDQQRLARAAARVRRRGIFVAVSGAWHPEVLALYPGWYAVRIERHSCISRRLHGRRKVSEVIVFSRRPQCLPAGLGDTMVRLRGRGI